MLRVLVIDDEKVITGFLDKALTVAGFDVELASNGYEGIERYNESYFDVVITDGEMPYLNGNEVLKNIRQSNRPKTPVIGMSGNPRLLSGHDFDVILPKPFSLKTLLSRLEKISYDVMLTLETV